MRLIGVRHMEHVWQLKCESSVTRTPTALHTCDEGARCHLTPAYLHGLFVPCHACRLQGLRMHDNPALVAACEGAKTVYPVFVLDPYFLKQTTFK